MVQILSSRRKELTFWLLLFAVLALLYGPALSGPFEFDDDHSIRDNSAIHDMRNVVSVFTSAKFSTTMPVNWSYRPLTTFSNMVNWNIGNGSTVPFRIFKLLIFTVMCFFLFKIWRRLIPGVHEVALLVGVLLFAINPVHTEVLVYVVATSTLLSGFFSCVALWYFIRYRDEHKFKLLMISLVSYFAATMSKEEGIATYALILFTDLYLSKIQDEKLFTSATFKNALLYLIPCGLDLWIFSNMYETTQIISRAQVTTAQYFFTQWRAWFRYMAMYVFAYDLNSDNLHFGFNYQFLETPVVLSLIGHLLLLAFAVYRFRKFPLLLFALLCFYAGISPASSIVRLAEPVNDHRAFLGYIGFSLLGIWLLNWLWSKKQTAFYALTTLLMVSYLWATHARAVTYSVGELFWRDVVAKNPEHARAHNNLGVELMSQGRYPEALEEIKLCSKLQFNYANCYINQAIVDAALGNELDADRNFNLGMQYDTFVVLSRFFYAQFLSNRGEVTKALALLEECDRFTKGHDLDVRIAMIETLVKMGDEKRVREIIKESIPIFGHNPRLVPPGWKDE